MSFVAIYAYPYVVFEPDLAWVVVADSAEDDANDGDVVGYILGTSTSPRLLSGGRGTGLPGLRSYSQLMMVGPALILKCAAVVSTPKTN